MLARYRPLQGVYDEMLNAEGLLLRPHWIDLIGSLELFSHDDFALRRDSARRILREHGVTYNVYADAQGLDRPWALDLVPLVIDAIEWRVLETGLIQRTKLLNLLLDDFYGPQDLMASGQIPPAVLFANPGFLRPCHGLPAKLGRRLTLHAIDLARSPDGRWWVLADRTQAPSGAGYALENRIVLSRIFPNEFRQCQVQRLANFFQQQRDALRSMAPSHRTQPNVVMLSPGPYNETYFEHALLARYLGFPLVEGADLTVRESRVFIKTLEGLQPVDVIFRRVDDTFCDPLELRADSFLGVAGLMEAVRAGNVTLANSLGSGAVETPALMPFLPGLCQQLLGEELILPSVATWWCGQENERRHVLDHLDQLVVKRAFTPTSGDPAFGAKLDRPARAALEAAISAAPYDFVGQETVALSTTPTWGQEGLEPRPLVLRTYVGATPQGYQAMPGGLTRIASSANHLIVSMQSGGGSKDTWVLADSPVSQMLLLRPQLHSARLERTAAEVPSRVADNLFWMGRYAERLEDATRMLRSVLIRLVGETGIDETPELTALAHLLVHVDFIPTRFRQPFRSTALEREVFLLIYQAHRLGTVRELLGRLRHIAFVLRDRFSTDTWRIVNKLQVDARSRPGRIPAVEALALLNTLIVDLAAFSGMEMENMTRGHGWRFLDIGRRLERAINVLTLAQGLLTIEHEEGSALEPALEIADSVMTYRRRYFAQPELHSVMDLLLLDESNPRSLRFQIEALSEHAADLPRESNSSLPDPDQSLITSALDNLRQFGASPEETRATDWPSTALGTALANIAGDLRRFSDSINARYFSHATNRAC